MDHILDSPEREKALLGATEMAGWFRGVFVDEDAPIGEINGIAERRIKAAFESEEADRDGVLQAVEVIWSSPPERQSALAYYFCGYPDDTLELLSGLTPEEIEGFFAERVPDNPSPIIYGEVAVKKTTAKPRTANGVSTPRPRYNGESHDEGGYSTDAVKSYLKEIGRYPLLNAEQEVEMAKQIEAGLAAKAVLDGEMPFSEAQSQERDELLMDLARQGELAKKLFVESNLRLVVSMAKRYTRRGGTLSFLDLIQHGNLGLITAVEKFNYDKGYKFSTYATWWIRQSITRGIADTSRTVRIPVHAFEQINSLRRASNELSISLGRDPNVDEIAAHMNITPEKVKDLQEVSRLPVYLDTPLGEDGEMTLKDVIGDRGEQSDEMHKNSQKDEVARGVWEIINRVLTSREAEVIIMRKMDGLTLEQVGRHFGFTRENARIIERKAMKKIREFVNDNPRAQALFADYMGQEQ